MGNILILMGINQTFSGWLQEELNKREWTQADLSRKSEVSQAQIARIMSGSRGIGPEACKEIAHALDLPEEEVFRQAGLLSPKVEEPPNLGEWIRMFVLADEEERDRMLEVARTLSRRSRK